jgi:hypothetical protein
MRHAKSHSEHFESMAISELGLECTFPHISFQSPPITTVAGSTLNKLSLLLHSFFPPGSNLIEVMCLKPINKKTEEREKEMQIKIRTPYA